MIRILLDSDVIIAHFRNDGQIAGVLEQLVEGGSSLLVSPIAYAEIVAGMRSGEERVINEFFRSVDCLVIDEPTGKKAGEYLKSFSKNAGVKIADALVAAVAHTNNLQLFTLNRKHYPMKDIQLFMPSKINEK